MQKKIIYGILSVLFILIYASCINDESISGDKVLSEITIDVPSGKDTIHAEFGINVTIDPAEWVKQSLEGQNLSYEWRASYIKETGGGFNQDSLKYLSHEPVLDYAFKQLGQYWLRLRVSNEDGSAFRQFVVYVEAAYEEGLFILSKDEEGKGRTTFMRVRNEAGVLSGSLSDFIQSPFETINPDFPLNDPADILKLEKSMFITSAKDQLLYHIDYRTFDLINKIEIKEQFPEFRPVALCGADGMMSPVFLLMGDNGKVVLYETKLSFIYESSKLFPANATYDDCFAYMKGTMEHCFFVNDVEGLVCYIDLSNQRAFDSKYFEREEIVNLMFSDDGRLYVVSRDKLDAAAVKITWFAPANFIFGAFRSPLDYTYTSNQISLTRNTRIIVNVLYKLAFYNQDGKLYRWSYRSTEPQLPEDAVAEVDGKITCMSFSSDNEYIYLGYYDPASKKELKGSVAVFSIREQRIVKEFTGVADRPIRVFYKNR